MSRELRLVAARLEAITSAARELAEHLPDLHSLAFDPDGGDGVNVATTPGSRYLDTVGNGLARHLWRRAVIDLKRADDILEGLRRSVLNLMMTGGSPEETRGSLIKAAEHRRLLERQAARAAAGDYVPARLVDQPKHPRAGR